MLHSGRTTERTAERTELARCRQCIVDLEHTIQLLEKDRQLKDHLLSEKDREIALCTAENLRLQSQIRRLQQLRHGNSRNLTDIPSDDAVSPTECSLSDLDVDRLNVGRLNVGHGQCRRDTPDPATLLPVSGLSRNYDRDLVNHPAFTGNLLSVPSSSGSSSIDCSPCAPPSSPIILPLQRKDTPNPVLLSNSIRKTSSNQDAMEPDCSTTSPPPLHITSFDENTELLDSDIQGISLYFSSISDTEEQGQQHPVGLLSPHRECTPPLTIKMSNDNHTISNQWGHDMASVSEDMDCDDEGASVDGASVVGDDAVSQISEDPDVEVDDDGLQVPTPSACPLPSHSVNVSMMQSLYRIPMEGMSTLEELIPVRVHQFTPRIPQIVCSFPNLYV